MKIQLIILLFTTHTLLAQAPIDSLLRAYNTRSVPYISVDKLGKNLNDYLILDTRKKEEYDVSHIPNAVWSGEKLDSTFAKAYPNKNRPIIVYCTVGIRSEDFGESLQKLGYTNVHNLYGSIFAWKDSGNQVVNLKNKPTDSVHIFSKVWGKYLQTGIKVSRH